MSTTTTSPDQTTTTEPIITIETGWDAWVTHRLLPTLCDGSYQQGTRMLSSEHGRYCVWGVAIDLAMSDGLLDGAWEPGPPMTVFDPPAARCYVDVHRTPWTTSPPPALIEEIGLTHEQAERLMASNDLGAPFPVLADIIANLRAINAALRSINVAGSEPATP